MPQQSKPTLKSYFQTGDVPTQGQFEDLIDSLGLQSDVDGKASASHTHAQSDVTGLVAALAAKQDAIDPIDMTRIEAPTTAVTAAPGSAGAITNSFRYWVSFVTADGETEPGVESFVVTAASQRIEITDIPIGPAGVIARKLWRAGIVGQDQVRLELVATINNNTATTYTDNAATLGGVFCSRRNTTGGYISISGDPVAIFGPDLVSFGTGNGIDPIGPKNSGSETESQLDAPLDIGIAVLATSRVDSLQRGLKTLILEPTQEGKQRLLGTTRLSV